MKTKTIYTCEYCGKQSENEEEIKACEAKHLKEKELEAKKNEDRKNIELALEQYKTKYGEDYFKEEQHTRYFVNNKRVNKDTYDKYFKNWLDE